MKLKLPFRKTKSSKRHSASDRKKTQKQTKKEQEQEEIKKRLRNLGYW